MSELVLKLDNEQMTKLAQNIAKELNNPTKQEFIPRIVRDSIVASKVINLLIIIIQKILGVSMIPLQDKISS